jgi:endonuclease-3
MEEDEFPGPVFCGDITVAGARSIPGERGARGHRAAGPGAPHRAKRKRPLDIAVVVQRIRNAVRSYAKAALFELADRGFNSVFEQLVACIVSIRTRDEVTLPTAQRLFQHARTAGEMSRLTPEEIDQYIRPCTFHDAKARQLHAIAQRVPAEHGGTLPCDAEVLLSFHGVGMKCTNLVLGIACAQPHIAVDVHVHRVTNRWGYVHTATPEQTVTALTAKLPRRYWIEINRLLVPFGKHICTGQLPHCSTCPVREMCQQVGVTAHR